MIFEGVPVALGIFTWCNRRTPCDLNKLRGRGYLWRRIEPDMSNSHAVRCLIIASCFAASSCVNVDRATIHNRISYLLDALHRIECAQVERKTTSEVYSSLGSDERRILENDGATLKITVNNADSYEVEIRNKVDRPPRFLIRAGCSCKSSTYETGCKIVEYR